MNILWIPEVLKPLYWNSFQVYEPTDDDDEEEEDDSASEYSEVSEDESESDEASLGSDEESGKDWSDLEREAAEEDREIEQGGFSKPTHKHNKHG